MTRFAQTLFFISLSVFATTNLLAQEHFSCGTSAITSKWTEDYLHNRTAFEKSNDLLYVPLTVYILGTDEGEGYASVNSILNALCTLNEDFAGSNIQFYVEGDFRYVNRTSYYDHNSKSMGDRMYNEFNVPNTLNCYLVSNANGAAGYAIDIGGNGVVIRKSELTNGNHTWGHEIGHTLGLYHTFFGWEWVDNPDYSTNAPNSVGGRQVERVNGSNCESAADGFCDTSPDYLNNRWECDSEGFSTILQKDPAGESFKSDGTNIMSYSLDRCVSRFSNEQAQAMRAHLESKKRNFLNRAQPVPSIDDQVAGLVLPAKNETIDFGNVYLEWTPVPDATHYVLEISRVTSFAGQLTSTYLTKTNSATITDLTTNRTYYWRVKAFNRNSFCPRYSTIGNFRTATLTAVNDLDDKSVFKIFPNPLSEGQTLTIQVNTPDQTRLTLRLLDMSGKLLHSDNYEVLAGESTLQFTPKEISSGMYLLNFITGKGSSIKRIVIE